MTMNNVDERSPAQRLAGLVMTLDIIPGIIGLATEYWLSGDVLSRHVGLWKMCNNIACQSLTLDLIPEWYNAVRGLGIMALCLHAVAVVTGSCCAGLGSNEFITFSFLSRLEEGSAIVAGILMVGGLTLFARSTDTHPLFTAFHFDWSFWLCVAHVCLLLLCGVVIALARDDCAILWRCTEKRTPQGIALQQPKFLLKPASNPIYKQGQLSPSKNTHSSISNTHYTKIEDNLVAKERTVMFHSEAVVHPCRDDCPAKSNLAAANSFMQKLEQTERKDYFNSLEGIPHLLRSLTHEGETKHGDHSNV